MYATKQKTEHRQDITIKKFDQMCMFSNITCVIDFQNMQLLHLLIQQVKLLLVYKRL